METKESVHKDAVRFVCRTIGAKAVNAFTVKVADQTYSVLTNFKENADTDNFSFGADNIVSLLQRELPVILVRRDTGRPAILGSVEAIDLVKHARPHSSGEFYLVSISKLSIMKIGR